MRTLSEAAPALRRGLLTPWERHGGALSFLFVSLTSSYVGKLAALKRLPQMEWAMPQGELTATIRAHLEPVGSLIVYSEANMSTAMGGMRPGELLAHERCGCLLHSCAY